MTANSNVAKTLSMALIGLLVAAVAVDCVFASDMHYKNREAEREFFEQKESRARAECECGMWQYEETLAVTARESGVFQRAHFFFFIEVFSPQTAPVVRTGVLVHAPPRC